MKYYTHWGSHLPMLIKVVQMTTGPILELGVGLFSTPFLHWACHDSKRELVSYDHNEHYINLFKHFKTDFHKLLLAKDWDKIKIERNWEIAFVDHEDARRYKEVKRLVNYAKYVIVHDTQPGSYKTHRYSEVFPLFKYRYDYKGASPNTTILSNFIDPYERF